MRPKSLGFIYVFTHPNRNDVKIGYTTNAPKDRARQIAKELGYINDMDKAIPFKVELAYPVKCCASVEKKVHELLRGCHVEREFFNCTVDEAKKIIQYNFTRWPYEQEERIFQRMMNEIIRKARHVSAA